MRIDKSIIFLSILSISLAACQRPNRTDKDMLETLKNDKGTVSWTLLPGKDILPRPRGMVVSDTSIVVLGLYDDCWIHTYGKFTGNAISSSIRKGQGPGEAVQGASLDLVSDTLIGLYDYGQKKILISAISSDTIIDTADLSYIGQVVQGAWALSQHEALVKYPIHLTDQKLSRVYALIDLTTDERITDYQSVSDEFADNPMILMSMSGLTLSPDKRHFATYSMIAGGLEFYDLTDRTINPVSSRILSPVNYVLKGNLMQPEGKPFFVFFASCSSNDHVYISYAASEDGNSASKISVWDWQGNLLKCYETGMLIYQLAYDTSSDTIYGLVEDEEGPALARLNLD